MVKAKPSLGPFLRPAPHGELSLDFADPEAVKQLNQALLALHYGLRDWDLPPGALCPPVPGRADYLHHLAGLLDGDPAPGSRPHPRHLLDIGTGASCIYPLLGALGQGWTFVATDISAESLTWAQRLVGAARLEDRITLRLQAFPDRIFEGITRPDERFDACLCNPPFHDSREEAEQGTLRKLRNLARRKVSHSVLNFGGRDNELWCAGGEVAFIRRMISESAQRPFLCRWYTTLVAKSLHLPALQAELDRARPRHRRLIEMRQGQKISRILAWSFVEDTASLAAMRPGPSAPAPKGGRC